MDLLSLGGIFGGIGTLIISSMQLLRWAKSINQGIYNHIAHQEIQLTALSERIKAVEDNLHDVKEYIFKK